MIVIALLALLVLVLWVRAIRRRKATESPEPTVYVVPGAEAPVTRIRYRFPGSGGSM